MATNTYTSNVDGISRQTAESGSKSDQRFARSKSWRLTHVDGRNIDPAAAARYQGRIADKVIEGEPGTFDDPGGAPPRSEFDPQPETAVLDADGAPVANPDYEPGEPQDAPQDTDPEAEGQDEPARRTTRRARPDQE